MEYLNAIFNRGRTALTTYMLYDINLIVSDIKEVLIRGAFAFHSCVTVWKLTDNHPMYYVLCIPIGLMFVEFWLTAKYTDDRDWGWFCPSVFLYLSSIVPGIWFLQFDMYNARLDYKEKNHMEHCGDLVTNSTGLRDIQGVSIPIALSAEQWALALEQIMFFLLIMGRWLLPKGKLTRDQLSQLLLVYVGIAADSLEFSLETLKIEQVLCDLFLIVLILGIWSWSLLQFTLVLTSVAAPRPRMAIIERTKKVLACCCGNEIWALIITMCLQDAPYLAMRLYLMIHFRVINQMMVFFTIKNSILVFLQLYRMAVLCCFPDDDENEEERIENGNANTDAGRFNEVAMDTVEFDEDFERIDHSDKYVDNEN